MELLIGDPRKAKAKLGWTPRTSFKALVKEMVECDLRAYKQGGKRGADKAD